MAVGVSRVSAAAVIVTASCLDLGPASANSIVTSKALRHFCNGIFLGRPAAYRCYCCCRHCCFSRPPCKDIFDKKDLASGRLSEDDFKMRSELMAAGAKDKQPDAPRFYAILPVLANRILIHLLEVLLYRE